MFPVNQMNCKQITTHIIIGKNFGDEGKGLAVDYFALQAQKNNMPCLVIRHNGGAQAGHTVDLPDTRFVFHQLSSGSFRGADTLWAETFLPDLYKLPEEVASFQQHLTSLRGGSARYAACKIYASPNCRCVCIDDVLVNMALETFRGPQRHGSCGMGINEAVLRSDKDAFRIRLSDVCGGSVQALYHQLKRIREEYLPIRLTEIVQEMARMRTVSSSSDTMSDQSRGCDLAAAEDFLRAAGEYGELLRHDNVLWGAAEGMCRGAQFVQPVEPSQLLPAFSEIIFEGAQGLLLDAENQDFAPHTTASRTGLANPVQLMRRYPERFIHENTTDAEAVYVTRTYVTRHGAGPLSHEAQFDRTLFEISDPTNQPNEWQGALRFAPHPDTDGFVRPVLEDMKEIPGNAQQSMRIRPALFLTHLDETNHMVCTAKGLKNLHPWLSEIQAHHVFEKIYLAESRFAQDCSFIYIHSQPGGHSQCRWPAEKNRL